jgi:mannosylglycoprotein endo-beta-mannosidase
VVAAVNSLYNLRCNDINLLNKASIILLPKREGVENISDFRPISLIHAVAKIITKILALRPAPFIGKLISPC